MDSVIFDGREYTKAAVLAERFRYTQDYLGQLCRAKKVDARLVGRAWYINLESLTSHKGSRYKSAEKAPEISVKKPKNNYLSRIDVEPILKQKTVKIFKNDNGLVSELPVKYEVDEYALIPKVNKTSVSVNLPVNPAGAEMLHVRKQNRDDISFTPEQLPEVFLHGTLKVSGLPEPVELAEAKPIPEPTKAAIKVEEIEDKNSEAVKEIISLVSHPPVDPEPKIKPKIVSVRVPKPRLAVTTDIVRKIATAAPQTATTTPVTKASVTLTPTDTKATKTVIAAPRPTQFRPAVVVAKEQKTSPQPTAQASGILVPTLTVLIALFLGTVILATNVEILASGSSYDSRLVVQVANLSSLSNLVSH